MSGKTLGTYEFRDLIGRGGTSVVYTAICRGKINVCKVADGKFDTRLLKEFEILRAVGHDNILKVFDCVSYNKVVVLATEYIGKGDLHDFILRNWPVPSVSRKRIARQVLSAAEHLHYNGIAHCDLKLENMLLTPTDDIKIIDFGSALRVSEATYDDFAFIATTPEYLPPEIFCATADENYDIRAIDEWSLGIVLFLLLTGRFPFGEVDQTRIAKYIKKMRSVKSFELRHTEERFLLFDQEYLEIVRGLLAFDHKKRLSAAEALTKDYFAMDMKLEDIEKEIDDDFEAIFDEMLTC